MRHSLEELRTLSAHLIQRSGKLIGESADLIEHGQALLRSSGQSRRSVERLFMRLQVQRSSDPKQQEDGPQPLRRNRQHLDFCSYNSKPQ